MSARLHCKVCLDGGHRGCLKGDCVCVCRKGQVHHRQDGRSVLLPPLTAFYDPLKAEPEPKPERVPLQRKPRAPYVRSPEARRYRRLTDTEVTTARRQIEGGASLRSVARQLGRDPSALLYRLKLGVA
jgi:hypothetical protein